MSLVAALMAFAVGALFGWASVLRFMAGEPVCALLDSVLSLAFLSLAKELALD